MGSLRHKRYSVMNVGETMSLVGLQGDVTRVRRGCNYIKISVYSVRLMGWW